VKREVSGKMRSKSRVLAAAVMAVIAITAIAYAQTIMGSITVATKEAVTVNDIGEIKFPARSAGVRTYEDVITLSLTTSNGFQDKDDVVVRVELVPLDAEVYAGFRALTIQIIYGTNPVATLTMNTPCAEFTIENITPGTYQYHVKIIFATGEKTMTVHIRLKVTIVGILP